MMKSYRKQIIKSVYDKFGWHMSRWAKERGFTAFQVYDFLRGRAGQKTRKKIIEALKKDGIEIEGSF